MNSTLQNGIFDNPPPELTYTDLLDSGIPIARFRDAAGIKNAADWKKKGIPNKFQPLIKSVIEGNQKNSETARDICLLSKSSGGYKNTVLSSWSPDFEGLVKALSMPVIGNKDGSYFIRSFGIQRNNADTSDKAYVLILDGDSRIDENGEIVSGAPKPVLAHDVLKRLAIQHLVYTSYSNDIGLPKYRVVIPCEYSPEQLPILLAYLFKTLHEAGVMLAPVPENRTWSQPWYYPRVPDEQRKALFEFFQFNKGENLNADAITAVWLKEHQPTPTVKPEPPPKLHAPKNNSIAGQRNPITEFNQAFCVDDILERNGYIAKPSYDMRWLSPVSETGVAGVQLAMGCKDGVMRVYSHHNDVLNDGFAHDAFDCFRLLECGGDLKTALAWNPELTKHNQRLYRQEQAKKIPQQRQEQEQHTDPVAQQNIIDSALSKLDDDIAAWYTPEFIEALYNISVNDKQEYKRIYHKLKKWKIAIDVDKEIRLFSKKRHKFRIPTLPALSTLSGHPKDLTLHQSSTKPAQKPIIKAMKSGGLLIYNDEGDASLVIESEGAVIMAECLRGGVAYSLQAKTWHIFIGTH